MVEMDKKAANDGDKLKHSLLLEVLARCKDWPSLTYAETHAGAGMYLEADQEAVSSHISNLFKLHSDLKDKPTEEIAGGAYYHLLQGWWAEKNKDTYPGSVLQAARFLTTQNAKAEYRFTEADKDTNDRLVEAVKEYDIQPEHAKFQNKIDWLTENDSLVLLIDPLSFGEDFGDDRDRKLNKGGMDLSTLTKVLDPCWQKKSVVVLLWSGFGHNSTGKMPGSVKKGMVYGWLKCICELKGASFFCFHSKSYCTFVMGIGDGVAVAQDLPKKCGWSTSWLSKFVRVGPCYENDS